MEKTMDKIVQVAKARGFVYPGSEIMCSVHGGRSSYRKTHTMLVWTAPS